MKLFEEIKKFNPYHGSDGKFTTGAAATSFTYKPGKGKMYDNAIAREKERSKKAGISGSSQSGIASAKTFDDLSKAVHGLGFKMGISPNVRAHADVEAVSALMTGVESVAREFPEITSVFNMVGERTHGVASTNGNDIYLNPFKIGNKSAADQLVRGQVSAKYWPQNSTVASIGAHEAGHCVEHAIAYGREQGVYAVLAFNKGTYANKIVSQACKNVKKTEYGRGKKNAELMEAISGQAAQRGRQEAFAEAFSDHFSNGENANPLSKEIVRLARQELDGIKQQRS